MTGLSDTECDACLLLQERGDEGEDVLGYDLVAFGGGVGVVVLHHAGDPEDVLEEEGQQWDVIFFGEQGVGFVELLDVVGAVVGGEGDAGEDDFGPLALRVATILSRLARESSMRRPRRPSLPPNSTTTTAGFMATMRSSRSTPSLVVLPLMPWLTTR